MPSHLLRRPSGLYYGVLDIPKAVRPQFRNKPRFVKSLQTKDRSVAARRVSPLLALWQRQIEEARGNPGKDDAVYWRRVLANAPDEKRRAEVLEMIEDVAWDIGAATVDQVGMAPSSSPEAREFYAKATGSIVDFTAHLEEWLGVAGLTPKTTDMWRTVIQNFATKFPTVQDVTRPEVRRWVNDRLTTLAPKTVSKQLSALRGYWRYLQTIGVAGEDHDPFDKLNVARQSKRAAPKHARQSFEPAGVVKLLDAATDDGQLADLIRLGMWTGCRIEELCALKVEQVHDNYFTVEDAKTAAGWRDIPIHRKLTQTMARLIDESKDGHVLSGLTLNKYGDRSNAVGKRFGRLKSAAGFGREVNYHSLRRTVITQLERAGVAEGTVQDIVGHARSTLTGSTYSGKSTLEMKAEALAKLRYP